MTTKQMDLLATKPETKKALAVLQRFAQQEREFKELEVKKKEAETTLLNAMIDHDVIKLEGDWGYITRATRKSYKAEDLLKDLWEDIQHFIVSHPDTDTFETIKKLELVKLALDTTKVGAQVTLTGQLPEGVTQTETQYITKKFKEIK